MAKQDDWIRITLRIPPELHFKLISSAEPSSMNAEIISRLEASFHKDDAANAEFYEKMDAIIQRTIRKVREEERKAGLPPLQIDIDRDALDEKYSK